MTAIDQSVSNAVSKENFISLTKSFIENDKNIETQLIASKFSDENGIAVSGRRLCLKYGYFNKQTNNFNLVKAKMLENCLLYVNQAYVTIKNNKNMYYSDYVIIGQVTEAINPPENIESYVFKEREVKLRRPRYNPTTGEFLGLYDTVGFLVCRGEEEEHFLSYGYDENKPKLFYSFYK